MVPANVPTSPNKTQYTAAKIVKGMEANSAPNFPAQNRRVRDTVLIGETYYLKTVQIVQFR